jgi:hypothetical protein
VAELADAADLKSASARAESRFDPGRPYLEVKLMFHAPTDLVAVATFTLLAEAEVARSVLAADGIYAVVQDGGFAAVLPAVAFTTGGVRLLVAPDEAGRARALLAPPEEFLKPVPQD